MDLLMGFLLSFIIAALAYKKSSLSKSGFLAALIVGTLLYFFGTVVAWGLLMVFFISSSLLTKIKENEKSSLDYAESKGGRRDAVQVLANGFLPVFFAGIFYFSQNSVFLVLSAQAIAVSQADTWASELGSIMQGKTVLITTFKKVPRGVNGGVSLSGSLFALLGASIIGLSFVLFTLRDTTPFIFSNIEIISILTLGGFLGCMLDSYLGATLQARYAHTAVARHIQKELVGGLRFMTNDVVNFTSSLLATLIVLILLI